MQAYRVARGWSLRDLAERTQLASNAIHEIETGAVDPRTGTMDRIARALECDIGELLAGPKGVKERLEPADPERFPSRPS